MLAFIQVVQLAKAAGASKIIGVASKSKCQSVVDNGADVCLDYGAPSFEEDLIKATERKVDVFFDNVGGLVLDAALLCMAKQGRISVCGAISGYQSIGGDRSQAYALKNHTMILRSVLTVKGFIVLPPYTSQEELGKAVAELGKAVMEGKVKTRSVFRVLAPAVFVHADPFLLSLVPSASTSSPKRASSTSLRLFMAS